MKFGKIGFMASEEVSIKMFTADEFIVIVNFLNHLKYAEFGAIPVLK